MSENKKSVFIFAIFINCFINYFFFVQEVVFLVIYFCFRFINGSLIDIIKKLLNCAFCGIFGIAMASVLFIPNIIYITSTTRNSVELALSEFFFNPLYSLFVAKGFLLPGETMHDNSSVISIDYSSTASYLPLVGLTLVIAYIIKNKNWLSRILKFLILLSFFPFASSCFILFTENNRRWWFMLTMLMALASAKVLENRHEYKKQITKGVIINAVVLTAFYLAIRCLPWQNGSPETLTFHNIRLFGLYAITLSGIVLVFVITKFKKHHYKCMVAGIVAFCVLTTSTTLYFYRRNSYPDNTGVQTLFELGTKLNIIDDQYRYNITDGDAAKNILTMSGEVAGISCFSSTVANSLSEFDSLFNFQNFVIRMDKNTVNGLPELLGAKYYISPKIEDGANIVDQITANNEKFYIIEKDACPIGYSVSSYICKEDLMTIEKDKRGIALLSSAVIESDKEKYINKLLKKNTANDIDFEKPISEYVEDNTSMAVIDFNRSTKGFTCKSNYDNDSVIYFTVPYDEGWTALIDGKEAEIIPSGGMMLLPINAGEHNIEFVYNTPGLKLGFTISAIAISFYILLIAFEFIYKTKKNKIITRLGKDENVS